MYLFHLSIAQRKLRLPIVRQPPPNAQSWRSSGRSITVSISRFDTRILRAPYPIFGDSRLENRGAYPKVLLIQVINHKLSKINPKNSLRRTGRHGGGGRGGLCLGRESDRSHFTLLTNRASKNGCMNEYMYACGTFARWEGLSSWHMAKVRRIKNNGSMKLLCNREQVGAGCLTSNTLSPPSTNFVTEFLTIHLWHFNYSAPEVHSLRLFSSFTHSSFPSRDHSVCMLSVCNWVNVSDRVVPLHSE